MYFEIPVIAANAASRNGSTEDTDDADQTNARMSSDRGAGEAGY